VRRTEDPAQHLPDILLAAFDDFEELGKTAVNMLR
jgi:hypothetical protein